MDVCEAETGLIRGLPRLPLAHLPTPLEELPRLELPGGAPRLFVKRDDLTGLATGGNKTRKLELLVAAALAEGADTLLTAGAVQSNHCRQTAAAAARCGLGCTLLLEGEPPTEPDGNLLLDRLFGAELRYGEGSLEELAAEMQAAGRRPYVIPIGGSNALGAAAYAEALRELLEQLAQRGEEVDWIVHASGSGGTQAGLAVGARALSFEGRILGVSVSRPARELQELLAPLATATARGLGLELRFAPEDFLVDGEHLGRGYGAMGELERGAIHELADREGLLLDPVYTGRAFGALLERLRAGGFEGARSLLFWHTGGLPALFAERYAGRLL